MYQVNYKQMLFIGLADQHLGVYIVEKHFCHYIPIVPVETRMPCMYNGTEVPTSQVFISERYRLIMYVSSYNGITLQNCTVLLMLRLLLKGLPAEWDSGQLDFFRAVADSSTNGFTRW